ncbi:MAG: hypothetical protein J7M25_04105 [Deltaproteobacteria bacterium]|nr:hypothetical protein [Deltaproteobacteria bacterium]
MRFEHVDGRVMVTRWTTNMLSRLTVLGSCIVLVGSLCFGSSSALAVGPRWSFEDAYDNVAGGDWYRSATNETATLAWGESYVMMSLASMYRATGDVTYLERLAYHADEVLANRDDARSVIDYRGVSGACWQDQHYQPNNEPYCYVVHSGMIAYPIAQFAALVRRDGLEAERAPDGETFGAKASRYVIACQQVVAFHDDQWNPAGYYVFRPDASFLAYPGRDLPLNQSNAMGRLLFLLYDLTSDSQYLTKATALAVRFRQQVDLAADGALEWNYWGGAYSAPGEDISHAGINVGFAVLAAEHGAGFSTGDTAALTATFMDHVYRDDQTFSDHVGGGSVNGSSYLPQVGRWLVLTPYRTGVYTAVRDLYESHYPPASVTSGSVLLAWAMLAEFEPPHCVHFFYSVDWSDLGDRRQATAYGANILTVPPSLDAPCMIPVQVNAPRQVQVQQWDGSDYHRVAEWQPTGGMVSRLIPYEPRWPFVYWRSGVLFQFSDSFVAGDGIVVAEPDSPIVPQITSSPPTTLERGATLDYQPTATGDLPLWWGLAQFPTGARIAADTGRVIWTADEAGSFQFDVTVENDWGRDHQPFFVAVSGPGEDAGPDAASDQDARPGMDAQSDGFLSGDAGSDSSFRDASVDASSAAGSTGGGCGCRSSGGRPPVGLMLVLILSLVVVRRLR